MVSSPSSEHNGVLEINKDEPEDRESNRLLSDNDGDDNVKNKILAIEIERGEAGDVPGVVPPFSWRKLWEFTGPGFLMSVAFLDPGNLEGDLQAGAIAGYSLLWLLMWSTFMGLLIQLLSLRLGVATGRHLAEVCREEYPNWARILLWLMAEVALIGADIQEVIGSAIAIKILSSGAVPLWGGVLITASDCFIFLFLENYGVRKLEAFFAVLISTMALSFAWMFADTKPSSKELIIGQYLQERYGGGLFPILYIWGIGLLAAGQSSTMTGTYAGQFIMGGFLNLRMKKWIRSVITRSCAIVPTIIVAIYFNRSEDSLDVLNEWLNVLQGMQIPFAIIPLLTLVSNEKIMGVFKIGKLMERTVWTIAALVIMINGYVMLNFFLSEVNGLLFGLLACLGASAYVVFLVYLISQRHNHAELNGFTHLTN